MKRVAVPLAVTSIVLCGIYAYSRSNGETKPKEDYNCNQFPNWEKANEIYKKDIADPEIDYHLDGDGDKVPCERLPGAPTNTNQ